MPIKHYVLFKHLEKGITNFILDLLNTVVELSTSVCLIAGLVGAILYIFGWEKSLGLEEIIKSYIRFKDI